jgi:hypothetical protein
MFFTTADVGRARSGRKVRAVVRGEDGKGGTASFLHGCGGYARGPPGGSRGRWLSRRPISCTFPRYEQAFIESVVQRTSAREGAGS